MVLNDFRRKKRESAILREKGDHDGGWYGVRVAFIASERAKGGS